MIQNNKLFFFVLCQFLFGVCSQAEDKKVVFVAGPKSHGFFAHEHAAGCKFLPSIWRQLIWVLKL